MQAPTDAPGSISRRRFLRLPPRLASSPQPPLLRAGPRPGPRHQERRLARHRPPPPPQPSDPDFRPLDDVIGAAMVRYGVPGVAVGVLHGGRSTPMATA